MNYQNKGRHLRLWQAIHAAHGVKNLTCPCGVKYSPPLVKPPDLIVRPDFPRLVQMLRIKGIRPVNMTNRDYSQRAYEGRYDDRRSFTAVVAVVCNHTRFTVVETQTAYRNISVMIDNLLQDEDGVYWAAIGRCPLKICGKVYYAEPNAELITEILREGKKSNEKVLRLPRMD